MYCSEALDSICGNSEFLTDTGPFPVRIRRDAIFLFKHVLKIRLAGKAEVAADLTDGFVRVGQQGFCLFQFAAHDKTVHIKSQFFFKTA